MTHLVLDANALAILPTLAEAVEIQDEAGNTLGYYHPAARRAPVTSPIPREELERRRQVRAGRPLADILRDLGAS